MTKCCLSIKGGAFDPICLYLTLLLTAACMQQMIQQLKLVVPGSRKKPNFKLGIHTVLLGWSWISPCCLAQQAAPCIVCKLSSG